MVHFLAVLSPTWKWFLTLEWTDYKFYNTMYYLGLLECLITLVFWMFNYLGLLECLITFCLLMYYVPHSHFFLLQKHIQFGNWYLGNSLWKICFGSKEVRTHSRICASPPTKRDLELWVQFLCLAPTFFGEQQFNYFDSKVSFCCPFVQKLELA